eukprot:CAMPEP_0118633862 /NCGR_PEP_ID=MMETSP0785-20121206/1227_1 /TAXON_ID=91992 /ORGANISM="Bolidomonas pacifica, Strain CCMP 1866" /LENGTH=321 /DNA_ID=CAMNT_0006524773 /DNA_START=93 /DNA_END=1055 /DNA_ORIENTATION=-
MSTTAQLAADAFLTEVFGDADTYTVSDGVVQGFSLQDFVAHCTISPMRTRAVGSLKILGQLLDSCMEKRGKWEEIAFVDPATEGTQFVRTLKVASCLGDINIVNFLIEKDGRGHKDAILGACSCNKPDVVTLILNHSSLKLTNSDGLLPIFVEACSELASPESLRRLLRSRDLKVGLRKLCDPAVFGEMYSHQTVLEHALINGIHCCMGIDENNRHRMHEIKAINTPLIRDAGPTDVDFAKNRFEQEMLDETDRHTKRKKTAVECFTTACHDFPLHGNETRRVFLEALQCSQDDIIQSLLRMYPSLIAFLEQKQAEGGKLS